MENISGCCIDRRRRSHIIFNDDFQLKSFTVIHIYFLYFLYNTPKPLQVDLM